MKDWLDIHALADGELGGEEKSAAEARIASDPACKAECSAVQFVKSFLRNKAQVHDSSASWKACKVRIAELRKRRRVEAMVGKYAWGMTSIFLAAILGVSWINHLQPRQDLGTGDVAKVVSGMAQSPASQSQPEDMKSWIKSPPFTLELGGAKILDSRSFVCKERVVDRHLLADDRGTFALLIVQGTEPVEGTEPMAYPGDYNAVRMEGANGVLWNDSGFTLGVVGPRPLEEMLAIAETIRLRR